MRGTGLTAALGLLLVGLAAARGPDDIDFARARELRQKAARGEKLTDDERAYLDRAIAARQQAARRPQAAPTSSTGLVPLTDLSAEARYKGEDGGLYGGGKNDPPRGHRQAALQRAEQIRPLDAAGKPAADGAIVLVSVGMSNTTQEFSQFVRLAEADPERSPRVIVVDGAQGGMDARAWAEPDTVRRPGREEPWTVLARRLKQAGVTPPQVQVVWLKQARINPAGVGEFPRHVEELQGHQRTILHRLTDTFPNLQLAYLSSRIYGGYATGPLNPEPYAYESAFAVRRLIRGQITGDPALNHDPAKGPVRAPLLLWGPYLWADGVKGRRHDDLVYTRDDLAADGTHPSPGGRRKVAELLLRFFKTDPTAKPWFTKK